MIMYDLDTLFDFLCVACVRASDRYIFTPRTEILVGLFLAQFVLWILFCYHIVNLPTPLLPLELVQPFLHNYE